MEKDELTLEELDEVTAGIPRDEESSKREKFMKGIKVNNDELTLDELDEITAGKPKQDKIKEER